MGYFVYKWVSEDEIVYIGKTMNPKQRFYQESKVEKFAPYLDADLYVCELTNSTEMTAVEKMLINKYQPKLNVVDTHGESMDLPFDDSKLEWEIYDNPYIISKRNCEIKKIEQKIEEEGYAQKICVFWRIILQSWQEMMFGNIQSQSFEPQDIPFDFEFVNNNAIGPAYMEDDTGGPYHISDIIAAINDDIPGYESLYSWNDDDCSNKAASYIKFNVWNNDYDRYTLTIYNSRDKRSFGYYLNCVSDDILFIELGSLIDFLTEKEAILKDEENDLKEQLQNLTSQNIA